MSRLENGARQRAAEDYASAIEHAFGDDPAVYVLRHVHTAMTVVNPSLADEAAIARRWAERTCAAVVTTVMRRGDDASEVMRFDDTPDFVAQFLAELLDGTAWDRWYFGAFSKYRSMTDGDAVCNVLLDFREHLAPILRRLAARGRWRAVLARIPPALARDLWQTAILRSPEETSNEQFRLFVRTAMSVADALELWTAERPDENELLAAYCETSPPVPDWKQRRALAEAVFAVLLFLERRETLHVTARSDAAPLHEALTTLEWLDHEWLGEAVEAWLRHEPAASSAALSPAARPPALTALQRRILDLLQRLLTEGAVELPDDEPTSERNALALFAALAAAEPALATEPAVPAAIAWFLQSRESATRRDAPAGTAPVSTAVEPANAPLRSALSAGRVIESRFAGVFLLTRALLDARLTQLASALGAVPVAGVLLALAIEWTGEETLDDGIVFWSGSAREIRDPREQIGLLDPVACAALRDAVERLMRDRAAFAPSLAPAADPGTPPLPAIASHLMRLWAHWLPGIGQSSVPWLLRQLVLRRGVLRIDGGSVAVSLAPAPLDVVLEMARYFEPIAAVPWLDDRRVVFHIDRSLA